MNDIAPDVIKSTSEAIHQNLPETAEQTDGVLSTVVGFFNNVVLFPVRKANITFKYKLESFEADLKEKIKGIPDENLQVPPTMISGPLLEVLRYTYDEDELRDMYENLLASAMDSRSIGKVHPSFVDAIKQMSPIDAKVIKIIADNYQLRCARISFKITGTNKVYIKGMPNHYVVELSTIADPFIISASITNLERLGLITVHIGGITYEDYESMKSDPYVQKRFEYFKQLGKEVEMELEQHALQINDYGASFTEICLNEVVKKSL